MQKRAILFISGLAILLLAGCGSFAIEPVAETADSENSAPEAQATTAEVQEVDSSEPAADAETAESPPKQTAQFMPNVRTFSDEADAEWGTAFCPESVMPICIRPYAIESLGDEQVLLAEVWGTGDLYAAAGNRFNLTWRAVDSDDDTKFGNDCGNTKSEASQYEAGFGYQLRHCFNNLTEPPAKIEMQVSGAGANFTVLFTVGDNSEPVDGYSYLINAAPLPIGESFTVGAATVTIDEVEDLGDALRLAVTITAPAENKLLVKSPEWLVIGDGLAFFTVTSSGVRGGWDEGTMGAYELVGGEIAVGESQSGTVILSKASADAGLLITYGPSNVGDKDAVTFLITQ